MVKEFFKYLLIAGAGLYLFFGIIRPALKNLSASLSTPPAGAAVVEVNHEEVARQEKEFHAKQSEVSYESSLQAAKQLATQSPKIVASVVQEWVNK